MSVLGTAPGAPVELEALPVDVPLLVVLLVLGLFDVRRYAPATTAINRITKTPPIMTFLEMACRLRFASKIK